MATKQGEAMRVVDYRPEMEGEIPAVCPECGAPIAREEVRGKVYVRGPATLAAMAEYGITEEGPVETVWWEWRCSVDELHYYRPILIGAA